uniref:Uncharacterized protein n=1 Tax=Anguilla anguilla TaxID=7936 RepID=A0A0E9P7V7_ANGAN
MNCQSYHLSESLPVHSKLFGLDAKMLDCGMFSLYVDRCSCQRNVPRKL